MTRVVIDASVAIKWVVEEAGSEAALKLLADHTLVAPDLLMPECANILWKKVRRREMDREEAVLAAELIQRAALELTPTRILGPVALDLAIELEHPAYDCIYLALAMETGAAFVTADERLVRVVSERGRPELRSTIVSLRDWGNADLG